MHQCVPSSPHSPHNPFICTLHMVVAANINISDQYDLKQFVQVHIIPMGYITKVAITDIGHPEYTEVLITSN